jgi:C-terminal processing protease CtpA/Prc
MFQVEDVTPNSPSYFCGFFKKGDLITSVDGQSVIGFSMDQFVDAVLGAPGSDITVHLSAAHQSPSPLPLALFFCFWLIFHV